MIKISIWGRTLHRGIPWYLRWMCTQIRIRFFAASHSPTPEPARGILETGMESLGTLSKDSQLIKLGYNFSAIILNPCLSGRPSSNSCTSGRAEWNKSCACLVTVRVACKQLCDKNRLSIVVSSWSTCIIPTYNFSTNISSCLWKITLSSINHALS